MQREKQIIAAARSYLGVPFAHQGRCRAGMDCLGLLVCVARDCQLLHDGKPLWQHDEGGYGHYPDTIHLRAQLEAVLCPAAQPQAGGVLLLTHDGRAQHLAIIGQLGNGDLTLIHAYAPARSVVEHRLDDDWRTRIAAAYRWID